MFATPARGTLAKAELLSVQSVITDKVTQKNAAQTRGSQKHSRGGRSTVTPAGLLQNFLLYQKAFFMSICEISNKVTALYEGLIESLT